MNTTDGFLAAIFCFWTNAAAEERNMTKMYYPIATKLEQAKTTRGGPGKQREARRRREKRGELHSQSQGDQPPSHEGRTLSHDTADEASAALARPRWRKPTQVRRCSKAMPRQTRMDTETKFLHPSRMKNLCVFNISRSLALCGAMGRRHPRERVRNRHRPLQAGSKSYRCPPLLCASCQKSLHGVQLLEGCLTIQVRLARQKLSCVSSYAQSL